ncbi:MAG: hypothetical protein ACJAWL_002607, partial [Motiliproteus sp.]
FDSGITLDGTNSVKVGTDGSWTLAVTTADVTKMAEGSETVTATQTDDAGNESTPLAETFVVDSETPVTGTGTDGLTLNAIAADNFVNETEAAAGFDITGTGEAGTTVTLSFDSGITLDGTNSVKVGTDGSWTLAVAAADVTDMGEGSETVTATQTDDAGNESTPLTETFVVDTLALPPSINAITSDNVVNDDEAAAGFSITGTGEAGATVNLVLGNGITLAGGNSALVGGSGNWSVAVTDAEVSAMGEGAETVTATQTDKAGNVSAASGAHDFTVDTTAPTATLNSTSTKAQSSEVGTAYLVKSTVAVTSLADILGADDSQRNNVAITAADTDTAISTTGLDEGDYVLYAVDAAGNLSTVSASSITIDNTGPTLASSTPNDEATNVGHADDLVLTFNENIKLGTGNISIIGGDDTITIDVANHNGQLTIVDDTLTIDPNGYLANNSTQYHVEIDAQAVTDMTDNAYAGITDADTLNFETAAMKTNVVVFDYVHGVNSSHNGGGGAARVFEDDTDYTIYILLGPGGVMNAGGPVNGARSDATNELWRGGHDLGVGDLIYIVGYEHVLRGYKGGVGTRFSTWPHAGNFYGGQLHTSIEDRLAVNFNVEGRAFIHNMGYETSNFLTVWYGINDSQNTGYGDWGPESGMDIIADTIPAGILTSQGLV